MKMKFIRLSLTLLILCCLFPSLKADDGYRLWMRYDKIDNPVLFSTYSKAITGISMEEKSPVFESALNELKTGLSGLLNKEVPVVTDNSSGVGSLIVGTFKGNSRVASLTNAQEMQQLGEEGYLIKTVGAGKEQRLLIAANSDRGVLYGSFHLLRLIQTHQPIDRLNISEMPKIKCRLLNHWDNLDGSVERGYAGFSLWDWHKLPEYLSPRYTDYARANASIGINGTVITNVNANSRALTPEYLEKVAALATVFRRYGIKVYLTARFSSPIEIGGLKTADPLDERVQHWWNEKADEIYKLIPDFGGFLIKANSEGQPGPQDYGCNHAEGANMLANAVAPHGGIVMWRAFVYSHEVPDDRAKQSFSEFTPLDGRFAKNVFVQVKNGAIDFQPREPFHPLFGSLPKTPIMMEFQITQEYLGQGTHRVYLAPLFKECLNSDTYAKGKGSTVAKVIDGSLENHQSSGIAGVANIGNDRNWCGHPFAQSNWYAFGRLAWNHELSSETIADEWLRMTFNNDADFLAITTKMMMQSRETTVDYMTPLGLHHIMAFEHHAGPGPWSKVGRLDWTSPYYHRADSLGLGFDRTATGSDALSQYAPEVSSEWSDLKTCPEKYLLWFHHLPWDYKLKSGETLWNGLIAHYYSGVESVRKMQADWKSLKGKVDKERFEHVEAYLKIQEKEAVWWRNSCLLYFQQFSKLPLPAGYEQSNQSLEYYKKLTGTKILRQ
jgi:alpha-glucuronidase